MDSMCAVKQANCRCANSGLKQVCRDGDKRGGKGAETEYKSNRIAAKNIKINHKTTANFTKFQGFHYIAGPVKAQLITLWFGRRTKPRFVMSRLLLVKSVYQNTNC